jgi:hypothetical protein
MQVARSSQSQSAALLDSIIDRHSPATGLMLLVDAHISELRYLLNHRHPAHDNDPESNLVFLDAGQHFHFQPGGADATRQRVIHPEVVVEAFQRSYDMRHTCPAGRYLANVLAFSPG